MPDTVYRESRRYTSERSRGRDDSDSSSSDDDGPAPTVRRYKVSTTATRGPVDHVDRVERIEKTTERTTRDDYEDDSRSHFSTRTSDRRGGRGSGDLLAVESSTTTRRVERGGLPERPRSAFEPGRGESRLVERQVIERERPIDRGGRSDFSSDFDRDRDRDRTVVYEKTREVERDGGRDYRDDRGGSRTVVERRTVERARDRDTDGDGLIDDRDRSRRVTENRTTDRDRDGDGYYDERDRTRTVTERRTHERDDDRYYDDRDRYYDDRGDRRTTIYKETREVERDRDGPLSPRSDFERNSRGPFDREETDTRVERRIERRDDRRGDDYDDVERYRKETEYYEPAPAPQPIVIRQRAPEQRIIVQEAPEPPPIVIPYRERDDDRALVRRDDRDDEYYYRKQSREVGPYGGRHDEDYAVERYDRRRDDGRRDRRGRYDDDGYGSDHDVFVRRTIIRRDRSSDDDEKDRHHRLHIAEGALAGAGAAAFAASRRDADGELQPHRGRKIIGGAVLGALGTEVVKRAKSAYDDRYGDDRRSRSRSQSGDRHSKLKTGLGLAAAALAVAGAAKYYQTQKVEKEEMQRGRSMTRPYPQAGYDDGVYDRPVSKPARSKSRTSTAAAAAGTAAVAGIVEHFRSKSRGGRSKSRLRTGAEIVAAGLVGAGAKKAYDKYADRKEERARSRSVGAGSAYSGGARSLSRDRSRSLSRGGARSGARSPYVPNGPPADPELGLVEYGAGPLASDPSRHVAYGPEMTGAGYNVPPPDARGGRARSRSVGNAYEDGRRAGARDGQDQAKRERSKSRMRDWATGAAAATAAAVGLKSYRDIKKRGASKDRGSDTGSGRTRGRPDHEFDNDERAEVDKHTQPRSRRDRDEERRRYEESADGDEYYDPHARPQSPPNASGGMYYPSAGGAGVHGADPHVQPPAGGGYTHHPNESSTTLGNDYQAYDTHPGNAPRGAAPGPAAGPGYPASPPLGEHEEHRGGSHNQPLDPDHMV